MFSYLQLEAIKQSNQSISHRVLHTVSTVCFPCSEEATSFSIKNRKLSVEVSFCLIKLICVVISSCQLLEVTGCVVLRRSLFNGTSSNSSGTMKKKNICGKSLTAYEMFFRYDHARCRSDLWPRVTLCSPLRACLRGTNHNLWNQLEPALMKHPTHKLTTETKTSKLWVAGDVCHKKHT